MELVEQQSGGLDAWDEALTAFYTRFARSSAGAE
jgi:hypothetical protein